MQNEELGDFTPYQTLIGWWDQEEKDGRIVGPVLGRREIHTGSSRNGRKEITYKSLV